MMDKDLRMVIRDHVDKHAADDKALYWLKELLSDFGDEVRIKTEDGKITSFRVNGEEFMKSFNKREDHNDAIGFVVSWIGDAHRMSITTLYEMSRALSDYTGCEISYTGWFMDKEPRGDTITQVEEIRIDDTCYKFPVNSYVRGMGKKHTNTISASRR